MKRTRATRRCSCVESANSSCARAYSCAFNARVYRHTVTRSRACVHFHRRARRNCKVAYMQGVKLGSRRFDPRPRIEISIRCNSSEFLQHRGQPSSAFQRPCIAFSTGIVRDRLHHRPRAVKLHEILGGLFFLLVSLWANIAKYVFVVYELVIWSFEWILDTCLYIHI